MAKAAGYSINAYTSILLEWMKPLADRLSNFGDLVANEDFTAYQATLEAWTAGYALLDVDGDGDMDLVGWFIIRWVGIRCDTGQLLLSGSLYAGDGFWTSDSIDTSANCKWTPAQWWWWYQNVWLPGQGG